MWKTETIVAGNFVTIGPGGYQRKFTIGIVSILFLGLKGNNVFLFDSCFGRGHIYFVIKLKRAETV